MEAGELAIKGYSLAMLGKYHEAIACCDKALELNPRDAWVWSNKGVAFGSLGNPQEEIACFERALEIDPRDVAAWFNKGAALI